MSLSVSRENKAPIEIESVFFSRISNVPRYDRLFKKPTWIQKPFIAVSRIDTNHKSVKAGRPDRMYRLQPSVCGYSVRTDSSFQGITMVRLPFFNADRVLLWCQQENKAQDA